MAPLLIREVHECTGVNFHKKKWRGNQRQDTLLYNEGSLHFKMCVKHSISRARCTFMKKGAGADTPFGPWFRCICLCRKAMRSFENEYSFLGLYISVTTSQIFIKFVARTELLSLMTFLEI